MYKKITAVLIALTIIFTLSGCKKEEPTDLANTLNEQFATASKYDMDISGNVTIPALSLFDSLTNSEPTAQEDNPPTGAIAPDDTDFIGSIFSSGGEASTITFEGNLKADINEDNPQLLLNFTGGVDGFSIPFGYYTNFNEQTISALGITQNQPLPEGTTKESLIAQINQVKNTITTAAYTGVSFTEIEGKEALDFEIDLNKINEQLQSTGVSFTTFDQVYILNDDDGLEEIRANATYKIGEDEYKIDLKFKINSLNQDVEINPL